MDYWLFFFRGAGDNIFDAIAVAASDHPAALRSRRDAFAQRLYMSEATLLELLRSLQQLELTVDTLMVTAIGKAVSSYRKHNSNQIRHLVQLLIEGWKRILDEWMSS
uniref:TFIIS N-terminal domain-containing protein n=1 Tax=Oryza nivara TaxID=4536 RepID=A0A0E0HPN5_ORYNI